MTFRRNRSLSYREQAFRGYLGGPPRRVPHWGPPGVLPRYVGPVKYRTSWAPMWLGCLAILPWLGLLLLVILRWDP